MGQSIERDLGFAVATWEEISVLNIDFRQLTVNVVTEGYVSEEAFKAGEPPLPQAGRRLSFAAEEFPFRYRDCGRTKVMELIAARDKQLAEAQAREDQAMAELEERRLQEAAELDRQQREQKAEAQEAVAL